jgi:hypothetical protein
MFADSSMETEWMPFASNTFRHRPEKNSRLLLARHAMNMLLKIGIMIDWKTML